MPTTILPKASHQTHPSSFFYIRALTLNIELYTDVKDPETETQIEDILIAHDLPYEKSEVWIESEKLYEVLYQTQIIGG